MTSCRGTVAETATEDDLEPLLAAVLASSATEEQQTLHAILEAGVDQGWFLRPDGDVLVSPSPFDSDRFFELLRDREPVRLERPDPWAEGPPPAQQIAGDRPGWVALTQRCDIVRSYVAEPLVELARASRLDGDAAAAAKTNSPRFVAFADATGGGVWAADLRRRASIPKGLLLAQPDLAPVIDTDRSRKRFRLRVGQRYWRDPVPDDLVDALQRPLRDAVRGSAARIATLQHFSMLMGQRADDGRVLVLAIAREGNEAEAQADWDALMELLEQRAPEAHALIEPEESGVYSSDDVSLGLWLDCFKFDFDELTYGRRASDEQADPPR
jgi:hypothetical protein